MMVDATTHSGRGIILQDGRATAVMNRLRIPRTEI
jgi:hypothetical protein